MSIIDKIDKNNIPNHVAIIMDGNGRWAKLHNKARVFGHSNGVNSINEVIEAAARLDVKFITLYAFSTENWNRPKYEVDALMQLLVSTIKSEVKTLNKNNIRLLAIGDFESLPKKVNEKLMQAIDDTKNNTGLSLVLALSYSSRWELLNAVKNIGIDILNNKVNPESIDNELFSSYLTTAKIPDPELLIRTSGEYRISNFLLWQIAYSELYFTNTLWPDFAKEDFYEAILSYQQRERRFGKISEQINE